MKKANDNYEVEKYDYEKAFRKRDLINFEEDSHNFSFEKLPLDFSSPIFPNKSSYFCRNYNQNMFTFKEFNSQATRPRLQADSEFLSSKQKTEKKELVQKTSITESTLSHFNVDFGSPRPQKPLTIKYKSKIIID